MLLLPGPCPHQSVPVEMDESMTSSSLELAWPPSCKQCSGHAETSKRPQDEHADEQTRKAALNQWGLPESQYYHEPRAVSHAAPQPRFTRPTHSGQRNPPHPAGVWPRGLREPVLLYKQDYMVSNSRGPSHYSQDRPVEEAESLEPPLPLMSDGNCTHRFPTQYSAACMPGQCLCCIIIRNTKHYGCLVLGNMYCILYVLTFVNTSLND